MKRAIAPLAAIWFIYMVKYTQAAPTQERKEKSLQYFDYVQPDITEYQNYADESDEYRDYEENDLSRTIPKRTKLQSFNSPIYYIRLPPQPYMFVPGLGYVSQSSQSTANQFLNVPINFISNGKPGTIYQWNGGMGRFPLPNLPQIPPKPQIKPDSPIHRLTGKYVFNGKPNDVFVLGDSYNSIYGDALQNFYP